MLLVTCSSSVKIIFITMPQRTNQKKKKSQNKRRIHLSDNFLILTWPEYFKRIKCTQGMCCISSRASIILLTHNSLFYLLPCLSKSSLHFFSYCSLSEIETGLFTSTPSSRTTLLLIVIYLMN